MSGAPNPAPSTPLPAPPVPATPAAATTAPSPPPPAKPAAAPTVATKPAAPAPAVRPPRTGDLRDSGVSRRDSVHATSWHVEGTAKVTGEVDVGTGVVKGTLSVAGAILADAFECRGTLDAGGAITVVGTLTTDGALRAVGPVRAKQASFSGVTRVTGELVIDATLTSKGQFAAAALRVGDFHADGAVILPGTLDAGTVDVRIRGPSKFGMIRARSVRLIRSSPNPIERVFGRSPAMPVARIEADRVELEGVDVGFVRCPEVVLGRDAHVTELVGTVVRRHSSASVGPRSRSPRPYGLSR